MKITKERLRELIQEELNYILKEERADEGIKDIALAGGIGLGSLFGGGANAAEPVSQPSTQVTQQDLQQALNEVLSLQRETYSVNFKRFDAHINRDIAQIKLSFDNFGSLEGMGKTINYLLNDLTILINNQKGSAEELKFQEHNMKLKASVEKLKKYI